MSYDAISRRLAGSHNAKTRKILRALKSHLTKNKKNNTCLRCTSYPKYGCIIIQGDVWQHIADVVNFPVHPSDMFKLQEAGLIEMEEIDRNRHRIVFVSSEKEEDIAV